MRHCSSDSYLSGSLNSPLLQRVDRMIVSTKKKEVDVAEAARRKAERYITRMGCYIPQVMSVPEELSDWVSDEGLYIPPSSATEYDDEQLGCALSYQYALLEYLEAQAGLLEVELAAAIVEQDRMSNALLGGITSGRDTRVSIEKAKARRDPELAKLNAQVSKLTAQRLLFAFLIKAYDSRGFALSRELTRRGTTTARWERNDSRGKF